MAKKISKTSPRKPRTDALRNRQRILEIAKEAFTRDGANASLDDIAKQAGVGAGTLYRHFPSRGVLIEAVFRSEVEKLAAAQVRFAETMAPVDALRSWMHLFVDHVAQKQIIAPALNSVEGGATKLYESSRSLIQGAMEALVKRAIACGELRADLEPMDLLRPLIGTFYVETGSGFQQNARRLVEILVAGSRPVGKSSSSGHIEGTPGKTRQTRG